jgi:hypothetical protein
MAEHQVISGVAFDADDDLVDLLPPLEWDYETALSNRHTYLTPVIGTFQATTKPILLRRGEGAYLFDAEGRRFLDMNGGFGMFNAGRNNPRIRQALVEALEQGGRGEDLDARGGELDGQRQVVEPGADLGDLAVCDEIAPGGHRAGEEQLNRLGGLQRVDPVLVLAGQVQRLPAGDQQGEVRARGEHLRHAAGSIDQVLEVVEQ